MSERGSRRRPPDAAVVSHISADEPAPPSLSVGGEFAGQMSARMGRWLEADAALRQLGAAERELVSLSWSHPIGHLVAVTPTNGHRRERPLVLAWWSDRRGRSGGEERRA